MTKESTSNLAYLTDFIGAKIKDERKAQNLTLDALAKSSDTSKSMLSKIENGRVFPTLPTLASIINALGLDFGDFFKTLSSFKGFPGFLLVRKEEAEPQVKEDAVGFSYRKILSHDIKHARAEVSFLTLQPNAKREMLSSSGIQYLFVFKGNIQYRIGETMLELYEGDSLLFDGNIPHVPHNYSDKEATLLLFYFINY